jgi:hypothetical protein
MHKKTSWDQITQIRKFNEYDENRRNIDNAKKQQKRYDMLKQLEEDLPEEKRKIEEKIMELMDIEQADELFEVSLKI